MNISFLIIIVTCLSVVLLYFLYKRYFENRYEWIKYEKYSTTNGKITVIILYKDKLIPGVHEETLTLSSVSRSIIEYHYQSKNREHRKQFFKKGLREFL